MKNTSAKKDWNRSDESVGELCGNTVKFQNIDRLYQLQGT